MSALTLSGIARAQIVLPQERFTRPAVETDEGGLWAMMDREETRLRRSPFVIKAAPLGDYLTKLGCKLAGEHCPDLRVHVVRTPMFNASMAPNGMMQVWSGLLLRVENEAQLAAVMGHELGHYLERHTLQRLRAAKDRAALAQFLGMFGLVGGLAGLGVAASLLAFSRDQEERADQIGMQLMRQAGYDGRQAAQVWNNLLAEVKVRGGEDAGKRSPMFATHPPIENRRDELLKMAGAAGGIVGAPEYEEAIAPHRLLWIEEELRRGQREESIALFDRMLRRNPQDGQALYARGETYRLRDGPGDLEQAVADLSAVAAQEAPPAEALRGLGLAHRKQLRNAPAAAALEKYLSLAPEAADAGLIQTYLSELKP